MNLRVLGSINISKRKFVVFSILLLALLATVNIFIGVEKISLSDLFQLTDLQKIILFKIRLPETLTALVIGAALGLSGSVMQTILNNPLASPFTLGISSASGFGASLLLLFGVSVTYVAFGSIFFSFLCIFIVYSISKSRGMVTHSMLLAGIAMKFLFESLTSLLQYGASDEALSSIVFWLFGNVTRTEYKEILIIAIALLLTMIYIYKNIWKLTAMRFGENRAIAMGVDVKGLKIKLFLFISVLTSITVSFAGIIGFVGICAPHISRNIVGEDQRFYVAGSTIVGAIILVFASSLTKLVKPGVIVPIGIISSLVGLPILFLLILGEKK